MAKAAGDGERGLFVAVYVLPFAEGQFARVVVVVVANRDAELVGTRYRVVGEEDGAESVARGVNELLACTISGLIDLVLINDL